MNSAVLDGRLFGGDSHDEAIASGAEVTAPSTPVPDHGSTLVLLGVALAGLGYVGGKFQARKTLDAAQR